MTCFRLLIFGFLGVGGWHGAVSAQGTPRLQYSVDANVLYDTNIARLSEAAADARGIERDDVRFTPALTVAFNLPRGRHLLRANANVGYDLHLRNSRLDRERLSATAGLDSDWGRCETAFNTGFERRQTEFEDIVAGPLDNAMTKLSASAGLSCPTPAGFYPGGRLSYEAARNSREVRRDANYDYGRAEAFLAYARPSLGEATIFAARGEIRYPERQVAGPGEAVEDRVQTTELGGRVSRELGSLLRGSVQASYTAVDRSGAGRNDFEGFTFGATLRIRPQGRLRGVMAAERAVTPTSRIGVSYSVAETYRADIQYDLTSTTLVSAGASLRRRDFVFSDPGLAGTPSQEDITSAFASVQTTMHRGIVLRAELQWDRRDADLPFFDYSSVRFGISSRWLFD